MAVPLPPSGEIGEDRYAPLAELLLNAVLEQLEIFLAKVGDRMPLGVADHRIDDNGRHARRQ
jgi:hypothetical protein